MKNRKLILTTGIIVTVTIALLITACKKDMPSSLVEEKTSRMFEKQRDGMKHVNQANYNLSSGAITTLIKRFKRIEKDNSNESGKLIAADSVVMDSAIWVVEAALNYDFDFDIQDNYKHTYATIELSCAVNENNSTLDSDDLETVYDSLTTCLNGMLDDSVKIEFVDVEGYLFVPGTNTMKFEVRVGMVTTLNSCSNTPFGNNSNTRWCVYDINQWSTSFGCSYPGNATTNATDRLTNALNCRPYIDNSCASYHGIYYTNINANTYNANVSNSTFGGALNLGSYYQNSWYCQAGSAWSYQIAAAMGNSHYTNCLPLAISNPLQGLTHFNTLVSPHRWFFNGDWRLYWIMTSSWGKKQCREIEE